MGFLLVSEDIVNPYILATDSTLIKANKGKVWHKSSMDKRIVRRSGIDKDARWGFSRTKGWLFGYKLDMYQVLVLSLYPYLQILQQPMFKITRSMIH
jgi:hypothetical protein